MSKYDFIQIGEKVKWDMLNDGNCKTMQICTSVHAPIKNNTIINLIPVMMNQTILRKNLV